MTSRSAEVAFGESQEDAIVNDWAARATDGYRGFLKGGQYDDFDYLVLDGRNGTVALYLEVKQRRVDYGTYGDVIFPLRKHVLAKELGRKGARFLAVTRYACGTLTEVDLAQEPTKRLDITRRDRPGQSVPHVSYSGDSVRVLG